MSDALRICTWNIDRSGVRSKWRSTPQAEWLTSQQADICVITEVHQRFEIAGQTAVAFSAEGQAPYANWEHAVGIWSRYPVIERVPVGDDSLACCVTMRTPVGPLVVYGTILPYRNAGQYQGRRSWELHECAVNQQIKDWEDLRRTRPDHHMVVAGDFNMTMEPSNAYVHRLSRQRLLQACEGLDMTCLTTRDTRADLGRSNIDHVLASRSLQMVGAPDYVHPQLSTISPTRKLSDHNAVVLMLTNVKGSLL